MLNAFRHPSGPHKSVTTGTSAGSRGAQRLPASKRSSPLPLRQRGSLRPVLNAFRHPSGPHGKSTTWQSSGILCSTPSGIQAVLTPDPLARYPSNGVLNAFRHPSGPHRGAQHHRRRPLRVLNAFRHPSGPHYDMSLTGFDSDLCSTPSGIQAVLTRP